MCSFCYEIPFASATLPHSLSQVYFGVVSKHMSVKAKIQPWVSFTFNIGWNMILPVFCYVIADITSINMLNKLKNLRIFFVVVDCCSVLFRILNESSRFFFFFLITQSKRGCRVLAVVHSTLKSLVLIGLYLIFLDRNHYLQPLEGETRKKYYWTQYSKTTVSILLHLRVLLHTENRRQRNGNKNDSCNLFFWRFF